MTLKSNKPAQANTTTTKTTEQVYLNMRYIYKYKTRIYKNYSHTGTFI